MSTKKSLTLGEIAKVEELSGVSAAHWEDSDYPRAKIMGATGYVILRRSDPKIKFEAVMEMAPEEVDRIVSEFKGEAAEADKSPAE